MLFGYTLLAIALTISTVAAYYSITGLTAIFAAAFWPIVIMGTVLELGKIATTVWLHKYWNRAALQFKLYLVPAIAILMLITSMGIFGLLSKAHLDQAVTGGDISSQVQIFDDKIKTERDNIESAKRALKQMDAQVDERLSRSSDDKGAERAVQIRRSQSKERTQLQNEISQAQKKISQLQAERAPIASQQRKVEADVGPIKYIAALIYGDNPDASILEKAVRIIIILIVLVFDPLALVLILAADQTFAWAREDKNKKSGWQQVWEPKSEEFPAYKESPKYEPDDGPLTDQQIEQIKKESSVDQTAETKPMFISRFFDPMSSIKPPPAIDADVDTDDTSEEPIRIPDPQPKPKRQPRTVKPKPAEPKPVEQAQPTQEVPKNFAIEDIPGYVTVEGKQMAVSAFRSLNPGVPVLSTDQAQAIQAQLVETSFGHGFPAVARKGDLFVRTDHIPTKLFKFNGDRWIELDKSTTDSYSYDDNYIDYLIKKIGEGQYDPELLSDSERSQLEERLKQEKL